MAHPDVRWTSPASWHLTLLFVGSVPATRIADLAAIVEATAATCAPWPLSIRGGDGRPDTGAGHDGVAWLRVDAGAGPLITLADRLAAAWQEAGPGEPPARRARSAHLTVVRHAGEAVITALRDERHGPLGSAWTADRIDLVRSHLERAGARYETLHEARLTHPAGRL